MPDMSLMSTSMIYTHVLNRAPAASRTLLTASSTPDYRSRWATLGEYPRSGYPTKSGARWWGEVPVRSGTICAHPDTLNRDTLQEAQPRRGYAVLGNYRFGGTD